MHEEHLIVFVKAPRPGEVKTRLAKSIGPTAASAAYRRLVETLLQRVASLPGLELRFTPDDAAPEILPWLHPGWSHAAQGSGDLGSRLQRAFDEAFKAGAQRVVVIGADFPEVDADDVREAWSELKQRDLVVGPATDGGYWLLGLKQPHPQIFAGVKWDSDMVLADVLQRAKASGLRVQLLRILAGIDTQKEWQAFVASQER